MGYESTQQGRSTGTGSRMTAGRWQGDGQAGRSPGRVSAGRQQEVRTTAAGRWPGRATAGQLTSGRSSRATAGQDDGAQQQSAGRARRS